MRLQSIAKSKRQTRQNRMVPLETMGLFALDLLTWLTVTDLTSSN